MGDILGYNYKKLKNGGTVRTPAVDYNQLGNNVKTFGSNFINDTINLPKNLWNINKAVGNKMIQTAKNLDDAMYTYDKNTAGKQIANYATNGNAQNYSKTAIPGTGKGTGTGAGATGTANKGNTGTASSTPAGDTTKNPQGTKKDTGKGSGKDSGTGKGKGKISADYGTDLLTPDQVRDLQKKSGELKVDGFVGPKTRAYAEKNGIPLTKEQFNAQSKVSDKAVTPNTEIPYTGKFSNMDNAAILYNLPSNVTSSNDIYTKPADVNKQQAVTTVEPGLASSTQFNANDFKRFDDIRALQADQGMSELEAIARYGQDMRSKNASGLADAVTPNKAPVPVVPAPVPVQDTTVATSANKVNPYAKEIARLNTAIDKGMQAVDAQNYMKATTGK